MIVEIDVFQTTTIAMIVLFFGYWVVKRVRVLHEYSIPEALVGGAIAAILIALLHAATAIEIRFALERRDTLLVFFFAALGLRANPRDLLAYGRPLLLLVGLASAFIVLQNIAGMALAEAFGHERQVGIVAGSMALTGRSGTTVAWAPVFEAQFGLEGMSRVGTAVNMLGLFAACCIGGPIARTLIRRRGLAVPGPSADLDVGISRDAPPPKVDYYAFLLALLSIHIAISVGQLIAIGLEALGVFMPLYVTSLAAGILIGNAMVRVAPGLDWPGAGQCLTLLSYVCLGLFYTMTLMSLQLWAAGTFAAFVVAVIVVQVLLAVAYIWLVVFPVMGRNYEAAVVSAGFAGIALGSTATTMAIISAVARDYGRARMAFLIVPVACGFFIDIVNSLAITLFTLL
jgi:ESS family glutamate:Na+ symporter